MECRQYTLRRTFCGLSACAIRSNDLQQKVTVTEAQVVYVNVGEDRKPAPIKRIANATQWLMTTGAPLMIGGWLM